MKRKVILLEINEITWTLIDPLIKAGKLPYFEKLKSHGLWGMPKSTDLPPQMDPWITWNTVYTGRTQEEHNVFHLQQPHESIKAPRLWEICNEAGLSSAVYGSLCSYPPKDTGAFFVPDTFSPDIHTFPPALEPIQRLNLTYTRSARLPSDIDSFASKIKLGIQLLSLGLSIKTCLKVSGQLMSEVTTKKGRWKRVGLQPLVNFDFFSKLYKQYRPDFATFHTNHVAHYQHTYWKAMDPVAFPQKTTREEIQEYGPAIEHGYKVADRLIGKTLDLCDDGTILVVASSMGQQPYISDLTEGKRIGQIRSLERMAEILETNDNVNFLAVMSDQFNIYVKDPENKRELRDVISQIYVDEVNQKMFHVDELDEFLTVTLNHSDSIEDDSMCYIDLGQDSPKTYKYSDLVYRTGMVKSGCHHPDGILMIYGQGIPEGKIAACNNLDLAPTILDLLNVATPETMKGNTLIPQ